MHADHGASALNSFTRPGERFHLAANGIYERFTAVAWNLAAAGPASGVMHGTASWKAGRACALLPTSRSPLPSLFSDGPGAAR